MFFKSCKYLTDYCLLLHLFQRKISSWSFYAKLEIELYRLWIIEWIAEFCCFWCLDHCIYTSSGAGLHPCPVLSSSILPSPHSPTSMLWQAALAFEIPVAPSWLSAGPLLLWSTCFCSSCFQLEGFSHLGQICCSFLPRTDCSNLRYQSDKSHRHRPWPAGLSLLCPSAYGVSQGCSQHPRCFRYSFLQALPSCSLMSCRFTVALESSAASVRGVCFWKVIPGANSIQRRSSQSAASFSCVLVLLRRDIKASFRCAAQRAESDDDVTY